MSSGRGRGVAAKRGRPRRNPIEVPVKDEVFPTCFDGVRFRGRMLVELDQNVVDDIGRGFAVAMSARRVIIGHDGSATAMSLCHAIAGGLMIQGADVEDVGAAIVDEVRYAILRRRATGGIYVSAEDLGGMTYEVMCMGADGHVLDPMRDMAPIARIAQRSAFMPAVQIGVRVDTASNVRDAFVEALANAIDPHRGGPCRVVMNRDAAPAMSLFNALEKSGILALAGIELVATPTFQGSPVGRWALEAGTVRNLLAKAVVENKADLGVFWMSGAKVPVLVDETGEIVSHSDLMAIIGRHYLSTPGPAPVVFDPRCAWLLGPQPVPGRPPSIPVYPGDDVLSLTMRDQSACFGFQLPDLYCFDAVDQAASTILPVFKAASLSGPGLPFSRLVAELRARVLPLHSETIFVDDPRRALQRACAVYSNVARIDERPSSVTITADSWRAMLCLRPGASALEATIEATAGEPAKLLEVLRTALLSDD